MAQTFTFTIGPGTACTWKQGGTVLATMTHPRLRETTVPKPPRAPLGDSAFASDKALFDAMTAAGASSYAQAIGFIRDNGFCLKLTDVVDSPGGTRAAFKTLVQQFYSLNTADGMFDDAGGSWGLA